ncbi:MAG TPA: Spy/CpxP family protein refolding chaperone [Micropepsaceae bacterium]|nr:Spy/CpxP family protein refolding chaperone [Micropepsaceae bacterium]
MNRMTSWRTTVALGIAVALTMAVGIQVSSAQTGPRPLPNLQNQQQDPQPQYDRRTTPEYGGQSDFRNGRDFGNPGQRLERRLNYLHTQLRITPAQERAWMNFTAVLRDEASDRDQDRGRDFDDRRGPASVLDRLEERQHKMADRTADLDRVIGALRPLYASFSEDQKRTADRLLFMAGRDRGKMRGPRGRFDDRQDRDYRY